MKRHMVLRWTALLFAFAALGLATWYLATAPKTLRIAAGPEGSQQIRFLQALSRTLAEKRDAFRLEIVPVASSQDAAQALEAGRSKLALLRSDDETATDARSIVIVQKRHVFMIARRDRAIDDWAGLRGRTLGLVKGETDGSRALIERILAQYGVQPSNLSLLEVPVAEATDAIAGGRVDALAFVGFPGQRLRRVIAEVTQGKGVPIGVIGVSNAGALAFRYNDLETTQLPTGVFSGSPPLPPAPMDTIAITHEIVASTDLDDSIATDLTRTLLEATTRMRRAEDNAFNIEAPPVDRPRRYPAHAGAAAYVNDEVQGFLETYSDYIWLALFGLSIVGSSITGFLGWAGLRESPVSASFPRRMAQLLEDLEVSRTLEDVDAVEDAFDRLLKDMIAGYATGGHDAAAEPDPAPMVRLFERLVDKRRVQLAALRVAAQ